MNLIGVMTVLTATSLAAAPADFAGTWKVKYAGPPMSGPKTIGEMIFAITVSGNHVMGMAHLGVWPGVALIADGKVKGDRISFTARGYLSSTTGIPTCLLEGTMSEGELVIHLSQIESIGGPGAGGVYEYRGGKLDDAAAIAAKIEALTFLSRPRRAYPEFPDSNAAIPLTAEQRALHPALNAARQEQAHKLAEMVEQCEKTKNYAPQTSYEGIDGTELDHLLAFYNSPLGQSLVATSPHGTAEIQTTVAQFVAQQ